MTDRRGVPYADFVLATTNRTDRISDSFALSELIRSDIAARRGIDNWFTADEHLQSAVYLCRHILQPLRNHYNRPFVPNSVYRNQAVERALKGKSGRWVSKSQHTTGQAADIEIAGVPNRALAEWIRDNLKFDQLIVEMVDPDVTGSGWIHVSLKSPEIVAQNRRQVLSYIKKAGSYVYVPGLVDAATTT